MSIALLIVSHSLNLSKGVVELASQMAPHVAFRAVGGLDGELGTSFPDVVNAIQELSADGHSILVLTDLGGATLTVSAALETIVDSTQIMLADAPLVEGAVAAAVAAEVGKSLADAVHAAEEAYECEKVTDHASDDSPPAPSRVDVDRFDQHDHGESPQHITAITPPRRSLQIEDMNELFGNSSDGAGDVIPEDGARRTVTLVNEMGLHARPCAQVAGLAANFASETTINGADARSVLSLLSLGLLQGSEAVIESRGADAEQSADAVAALLESGFGELPVQDFPLEA